MRTFIVVLLFVIVDFNLLASPALANDNSAEDALVIVAVDENGESSTIYIESLDLEIEGEVVSWNEDLQVLKVKKWRQ